MPLKKEEIGRRSLFSVKNRTNTVKKTTEVPDEYPDPSGN